MSSKKTCGEGIGWSKRIDCNIWRRTWSSILHYRDTTSCYSTWIFLILIYHRYSTNLAAHLFFSFCPTKSREQSKTINANALHLVNCEKNKIGIWGCVNTRVGVHLFIVLQVYCQLKTFDFALKSRRQISQSCGFGGRHWIMHVVGFLLFFPFFFWFMGWGNFFYFVNPPNTPFHIMLKRLFFFSFHLFQLK